MPKRFALLGVTFCWPEKDRLLIVIDSFHFSNFNRTEGQSVLQDRQAGILDLVVDQVRAEILS